MCSFRTERGQQRSIGHRHALFAAPIRAVGGIADLLNSREGNALQEHLLRQAVESQEVSSLLPLVEH